MLRKLPILALIFVLALPLAHADDASKRAKLDQLFVLMKINALMDQIMQTSMAQGEQVASTMFGGKPPSPEDRKILDAYELNLSTLLKNTLSWDKLEPSYVDLYASAFSEEDIDGMIAFYKSPAGQHMVEKSPELLTASQKIVLGRFQNVQPQMQAMTKDMMNQLMAAHPELNPSK
jgi:hypothetical protein